MPDYYFELRHQQLSAMHNALAVFDELADEFGTLSGRQYRSLEPYALDGAEHAIVCLGSSGGTVKDSVDELRRNGEKVGLLEVRSYPAVSRKDAIHERCAACAASRCSTAPTRPAVRRRSSPRSLLPGTECDVELRSYVYGLGGRDLHPEDVEAVFHDEISGRIPRLERRAMSRLKMLVRNENGTPPLRGGHALCQGCGAPMVVRTIVNTIDTPVVIVSATGCLEVATSRFPTTAWNVPWLHVAFENAAAVVSGVETAYRALAKRDALPQEGPITFIVLAGDGGTYDIGLQSLSGALERGHRFIFVCYDNEAYMNTGVQRSGATPFGANTTTSGVGAAALGKAQQRKDMSAIAVAHHVPYVAQAVASHWQDLSEKAERAANAGGPAFLNVLTNCPLGWGHEPRLAPRLLDCRRRQLLLAALRRRRRALPAHLHARRRRFPSRSGFGRRRASRTCSRRRPPQCARRSSAASTRSGTSCSSAAERSDGHAGDRRSDQVRNKEER